jgi:alpha-beta hydrolase superfamily lysophospholipase
MRARVPHLAIAASAALLAACLGVDTFFFAARRVEAYRFDEADPEMDGDLSAPHPSIVPASLRAEGLLTSDEGDTIHWVLARHPEGAARATILLSHGNGPHLGRFWDRVELLWQLGFQVAIYDYPGFGRSTGRPSEPGMIAAGRAVLAMLADRPDVDRARLVLYGHSLGGAPTFELAVRARRGELDVPVAAVVGENVWCSMQELLTDGVFLDLPRELFSDLRFDNCAALAALRGVRVLLLHGGRDRIVSGRQLALLVASAAEPPEVHVVPDAGHVDVSTSGGASTPTAAEAPQASPSYAAWVGALAP